MKRLLIILFCAMPLFGQSNTGELRLKVIDPSGLGVKTTVQVVSEANQYQNALTTDDQGNLDVERLPFGVYQLDIHQPGFADVSQSVEIRSSIPAELSIKLQLAQATQKVTVTAANTLINPDQAGAVSQIGSATIQSQPGSLPGRSLQDLVNSQPGWLYEGNAVLH
ncbi:MAG: carboxypeptidase-like regulatory domain-containing protein, partial [Candidatus Acidiferrales bacterium]